MSRESIATTDPAGGLAVEEEPLATGVAEVGPTRAAVVVQPTADSGGSEPPAETAGEAATEGPAAEGPAVEADSSEARSRDGTAAERAIENPATATTGAVAFAILRGQYDLLRAHEPAVERVDDPEALHQLRVDIRRLRAALALFADALPVRAAVHRERLGEIGALLGAVRDLDVQMERVTTWTASAPAGERDALEVVATVLEERQRRARRRAVAALSSKRTSRSLASLERFIAHGPLKRSSTAQTPLVDLAPEILAHEHRRLVTIGDSIGAESPPEALHSLRIRCKRLRYGVEFLEPWYGKAARAYVKRLIALQDTLGAHQDAVVAAATLREIGLDRQRRLTPIQLISLGGLIERSEQEARSMHERMPTRYARAGGRRWRRLVRIAERARTRRA
jgi:CHAD domain-containing protein